MSRWLETGLYAQVKRGIVCPREQCGFEANTSIDVVCRGECAARLIVPSNPLTRVLQNRWFIRSLPLPTVVVAVRLYDTWPLYLLGAFFVLLFLSLFLRNHKGQLLYFLGLGSIIFCLQAWASILNPTWIETLRSGGSASQISHFQSSRVATLVADFLRPISDRSVDAARGLDPKVSAFTRLFLGDPAHVAVYVLVGLGGLFFSGYVLRFHLRRSGPSAVFLSMAEYVLAAAFLIYGYFRFSQIAIQANLSLKVSTWIGLALAGSLMTFAMVGALSRAQPPTDFRIPHIPTVSDDFTPFPPIPIPPIRPGLIGTLLSALVRSLVRGTNAALREVNLAARLVINSVVRVLNALSDIGSLVIRLLIRFSRYIYTVAWEVAHLVRQSVLDVLRVAINLVRFLLGPSVLLVLASLSLAYLTYAVFAYFFGGTLGYLTDMAVSSVVTFFAVSGVLYLLTVESTFGEVLSSVARTLIEYGFQGVVWFVVYSFCLSAMARVFGGLPFRFGPVSWGAFFFLTCAGGYYWLRGTKTTSGGRAK